MTTNSLSANVFIRAAFRVSSLLSFWPSSPFGCCRGPDGEKQKLSHCLECRRRPPTWPSENPWQPFAAARGGGCPRTLGGFSLMSRSKKERRFSGSSRRPRPFAVSSRKGLPAGGRRGGAFCSGPLNHFLLRSPAFCRPCRLAPPQHFFFFNWQLSRSEVRRLFSKCLIRYDASRARFDVRTPSIRSHSVRALTLVSRLRAADEAG